MTQQESEPAEGAPDSVSEINIHPWAQLVYAVRTTVVSVHHNVCASLADRFLPAWRQSIGKPVWLLGQRFAGDGEECENVGTPEEFAAAWSQITRMTYREGFAPMYRPVYLHGADERTQQYVQLTSDAGWGCMIRVGQMLLITALKRHQSCFPTANCSSRLHRKFLDDPSVEHSPFSIFGFIRAAKGGELALLPTGHSTALPTPAGGRPLTQKLPGDWFGPTTISETIAALLAATPEHASHLSVFVNPDGVLYEDEIRDLAGLPADSCPQVVERSREADDGFVVLADDVASKGSDLRGETEFEDVSTSAERVISVGSFYDLDPATRKAVFPDRTSESPAESPAESTADEACSASASSKPRQEDWSNGVLILFPVQLGLDKYINEACVEPVLRYFEIPQSLGAMGGRPRMAHFFVGQHDQGLLYVDPHVVQPAATLLEDDVDECSAEMVDAAAAAEESFRNVPTVQVIPVEHIDSSLSIAFYCSCEAELQSLSKALREIEQQLPAAPLSAEAARPAALRMQDVEALSDDDVLWEPDDRPEPTISAVSPARIDMTASGHIKVEADVVTVISTREEVADGRSGCRTVMVPAEEAWSGGGWSMAA